MILGADDVFALDNGSRISAGDGHAMLHVVNGT
jgi:hypothetical protein